jgi:hypothetical protein
MKSTRQQPLDAIASPENPALLPWDMSQGFCDKKKPP